jgi:hypothetical protein
MDSKKSKKTGAKCTEKLRILLIDDEKEYFHQLKRSHPECSFEYSDNINTVPPKVARPSRWRPWAFQTITLKSALRFSWCHLTPDPPWDVVAVVLNPLK